tara:strand:+ start:27804 stop:29027 length:1224 start_codon:yes stop_codon:yes gene_type:complete
MESLVKIVQDLSKVRSVPEIVNIVRKAARSATGADGATFVMKDNGYCFYVDEDAIGPLWKGKRFPLTACISGWAMLNKQAVAIPDIFQDDRIPVEAYRPTFVKSLAMMPVRKSDPIASIGIYWAQKHTATEEELSILQAIADTTSVAIENVQLLSSLEERVNDLELANRAKDEFLMLISHELRTPLNSIMGWSEMLSDRDADPSLVPVGMDAINRNTKTQGQVIDRLLDASQIVLGKFAVHKQEIDLVSLIRAALAEYLPMAQKKNISVVFNSKLNQALINADADRLRQAMGNLIDNAIKFSNDHNRIFLELAQQGPSLIFKVKDFGAGVDKNLQAKLFDRFSQTEAYITRSHGGLGLGLTIAKSIVNSHQGEIQVSSAGIGQGSEFSISLPYGSVQKSPGLDHSLT